MHHNKIFVSKTIHLPNNNTTKMEVLFKSIYMFQHLRKHQIIPNVIYFQYVKVCDLSISISIEIIVQIFGSSMFLRREHTRSYRIISLKWVGDVIFIDFRSPPYGENILDLRSLLIRFWRSDVRGMLLLFDVQY